MFIYAQRQNAEEGERDESLQPVIITPWKTRSRTAQQRLETEDKNPLPPKWKLRLDPAGRCSEPTGVGWSFMFHKPLPRNDFR